MVKNIVILSDSTGNAASIGVDRHPPVTAVGGWEMRKINTLRFYPVPIGAVAPCRSTAELVEDDEVEAGEMIGDAALAAVERASSAHRFTVPPAVPCPRQTQS